MKKIAIFLALFFAVLGTQAQSRGSVITLAVDTLQGAETVQFTLRELRAPSYDYLVVDALCTQLGGTSDGTLALYGSLDNTNWVFINGVGDLVTASPQASLTGADSNQVTITNGLVASWVLTGVPWRYYRVTGVGTTGDTTQVNIKYRFK